MALVTKDIIVEQGQTLKDIGLQYWGTIEGWFLVADMNGLKMTELLAPGQVLKVEVVNNETVKYLEKGNHVIATLKDTDALGIGYMKIGVDFKVGIG